MSEDRLREEALAVLEKAKLEDFDGHTEFYRMTPLERLRWLDQAVEMVLKLRPKSRQNAGGYLAAGCWQLAGSNHKPRTAHKK